MKLTCVGVCMKFLWGPLCLLAAAATAKSSYNRHALQMLGSMAHIYGCLLYIVTSWEEGHRHSRHLHISLTRDCILHTWGIC